MIQVPFYPPPGKIKPNWQLQDIADVFRMIKQINKFLNVHFCWKRELTFYVKFFFLQN